MMRAFSRYSCSVMFIRLGFSLIHFCGCLRIVGFSLSLYMGFQIMTGFLGYSAAVLLFIRHLYVEDVLFVDVHYAS